MSCFELSMLRHGSATPSSSKRDLTFNPSADPAQRCFGHSELARMIQVDSADCKFQTVTILKTTSGGICMSFPHWISAVVAARTWPVGQWLLRSHEPLQRRTVHQLKALRPTLFARRYITPVGHKMTGVTGCLGRQRNMMIQR